MNFLIHLMEIAVRSIELRIRDYEFVPGLPILGTIQYRAHEVAGFKTNK